MGRHPPTSAFAEDPPSKEDLIALHYVRTFPHTEIPTFKPGATPFNTVGMPSYHVGKAHDLAGMTNDCVGKTDYRVGKADDQVGMTTDRVGTTDDRGKMTNDLAGMTNDRGKMIHYHEAMTF